MCFSATASFTASAALTVIGAVTISRANTRPQKLLALAPLMFASQQLSEGFLWLSFTHPEYAHLQQLFVYSFLAMAQVIWPVFVPLSVYLYEKEPRRKKMIRIMLWVGVLTSLYFLYTLLAYPVTASGSGHHIRYNLTFPIANKWYTGITYMFAVLAPFVSSIKRFRYLALLLVLAYLPATIFYHHYMVSVWCFFAAIISSYIWYMITEERKEETAFYS